MQYIYSNIIWILLIFIIIWIVIAYNSLIRLRNRIKEAWSDINVQLKRRYDLIPNLVEIVKGYAAHEKNVLENITNARSKAMNAENKRDKMNAENQLSNTLKTLFAVAENYPNLKANANFLDLQRELVDTENKIQSARRFYNGVVVEFNTRIQTFPTNLIANIFKFEKEDFFEINKFEKNPVDISFNNSNNSSQDNTYNS